MKQTSTINFSSYISPFTWRYSSPQMRHLFSEEYKFNTWRQIWVALAKSQYKLGLLTKKEFLDLKKNQSNIDINRILEIEKETKHDVVAAIKEFAEKAKIGGGKIHLGATSMDINDNAETYRIKQALELIETKVKNLLKLFSQKINNFINVPCIGYTHLQPAEPTTIGYRFAFYAQDLLIDYNFLQFVKNQFKAKGFKGAVGTSASYDQLFDHRHSDTQKMEDLIMKSLDLKAFLITSQTSTRKVDYLVLSLLSSIASTLAKFSGDIRLLQSPNNGEWQEPFSSRQVGSSAMPFKKNPINSEKICSLARYMSSLPQVALENATLSFLERTLDDSANRRIIISESFLALDEILITAEKNISGLVINNLKVKQNFDNFAPFAATESIIIESVKKGANRQEIHEVLRLLSLKAWADIQKGDSNSLQKLITNSPEIKKYLSLKEINKLFNLESHLGTAIIRSKKLIKIINQNLIT
jgi:adenylosuccinate lyase